jgi:alpha-tubulin suppressor-like RCC1 family protein
LWAWGSGSFGQLGISEHEEDDVTNPSPVLNIENCEITSIAGGLYHSAAIINKKTLLTWGKNSSGQLGRRDKLSPVPKPTDPLPVASDEKLVQVACGVGHTLLLTDHGRVLAIGSTSQSSAGEPSTCHKVADLGNIVRIKTGGAQNFAIDSTGRLFVWGDNSDHQLGIEQRGMILKPTQVRQLAGVQDVACGVWHSVAVTSQPLQE